MPNFSARYCRIINNEVVRGPGPLPYHFNDAKGDIIETTSKSDLSLQEDYGWFFVHQTGKRDVDPGIERIADIEFKIIDTHPHEIYTYKLTENAVENMILNVDKFVNQYREVVLKKHSSFDLEYQMVVEEAKRVLESDDIALPKNFPMLSADINNTVMIDEDGNVRKVKTILEAAHIVMEQWNALENEMKTTRKNRLEFKRKISEAKTPEKAFEIYKKFLELYS